MRRALGLLLLAVLCAVGLLWPVVAQLSMASDTSSGSDPVTITMYTASYDVSTSGLLTARETIEADFPAYRHGLFRFWDRRDPSDSHNRYTPEVASITMDGHSVPYSLIEQGGGRYVVAQIGDAGNYLSPGQHTYVIDYVIPGAISPGDAGLGIYATDEGSTTTAPSDFYWNVVAPGWQNDIRSAVITVRLPSPALGVQCSAGTAGGVTVSEGPCGVTGVGTREVQLTARDIPPSSGMTVRIPMAMSAPQRASVPWPILFDKVLGVSLLPVIVVALLTAAGLAVGLARVRSTREPQPGFPVMYAPPAGLGPAQVVYVDTEGSGSSPLLASVLHLADRGLVSLEHRADDSWLVTGTGTPEQWAEADEVSRSVGESLGVLQPGYWFLADRSTTAGQRLLETQKSIGPSLTSWGRGSGLFEQQPGIGSGCMLWTLALVLAVVGFTGWHWPTMWGLPFAAFAASTVAVLSPASQQRRTESGRRAWSEAGGFRRMLSTPSSEERFDFAARKDLFIHYVPYAVAFGVADRWAQKYRVETNEEPPVPAWYPMAYVGSSLYSGSSGFDSFDSSMSSAIGAYQASQSASSSGGGGGGFGGGGGGGGGGSW